MATSNIKPNSNPHYGAVFLTLVILTVLESVMALMLRLPTAARVAALALIVVIKVALILMYFMHLRTESRVFGLPFVVGTGLAALLIGLAGLATADAPIRAEAVAVSSPGQVIDITEVSFQIQTPLTAQAGPVTFHVVNGASGMLHEFIVIQTDLPADALPTDESGRVIEEAVDIVTAAENIPPGQSRNLTLNLAPGHYVLICNLPEHYQKGMRVDFTVTGTSSLPPSTLESPASQPTKTS